MKNLFKHWRQDVPASLVVFLVALPLCLGVGLASTNVATIGGLPNLFSGLVAGIIGGVVIGLFSGSRLGVSGPAAGLITIVLTSITALNSFEGFLVAVVLAGVLQIIAGYLKLGILANYFPSSVIKGMLAAIGITLILKEIPHALGYDADFFGDESFFQMDGHNTFSELVYALNAFNLGSIIISVVSVVLLFAFDHPRIKKISLFTFLPGALFVVVIGILLQLLFSAMNIDNLTIGTKHLVQLPTVTSLSDFGTMFTFPDFTFLSNPKVYMIAGTIALVASLETLLSVEATDKLDPEKHRTPTNRELKAQGIGNIVSGLIGGLPLTQVIVRSSANIGAGGKSKLSTIVHGLLLFIAVLFFSSILNMIPLASLAGLLIVVGYKLSKIQLYKQVYALGLHQFIPFVATIIGVLLTDLLKGIAIGLCVSIFYILKRNYKNNYTISRSSSEPLSRTITLSEEVTFLNKGSIFQSIYETPDHSTLIIDGTRCVTIDYDVLEIIEEFRLFGAKEKNIKLTTINIPPITSKINH